MADTPNEAPGASGEAPALREGHVDVLALVLGSTLDRERGLRIPMQVAERRREREHAHGCCGRASAILFADPPFAAQMGKRGRRK